MPLRLIATLTPKPGHEAELLAAARLNLIPTRAEPGCHLYELFQSHQSGRLLFNELWTDHAALEAHAQTPHMQRFAQTIPPLLAEPLTLDFLTEVEP